MAYLDDQKKLIQDQLAQQKASVSNSLVMQKQNFDNTINKNKSYLNEQIQKTNNDRIVNDDQITALNNRRGGFYSGGLDYQIANNLRNTQTAQNSLTRDINTKNQEINSQYLTLASQAANQIKMLENESTDKIRALVNAELEKQRALSASRARSSRGGSSGGQPSAVPANVQEFAKSNTAWFTPTNGKEQMTYSTNGITRESPVYGNYSPQQSVQPSAKPYKFTPQGKIKQYSY